MYSDMSMRTIASWLSNMNSASARASSVLPTPVGPRNRNTPIGRSGSASPARERRSALETLRTASSWPMTRRCRRSSMCTSFSTSPSMRRLTGMPVQRATTSATSSASTSSLRKRVSRGALQVGLALGALELAVGLLEALLELLHGLDGVLLDLPLGLHRARLLAQLGELALDRLAALDRRRVGLLLQRRVLDLELQHPAVDLVDLLGQRVDLDAQPRRRLVDQVDRLVGQEAVGDVAVAQRGRRDQRAVLDAHAVVHLVALLEPAQDRDRVLDGRLADQHRLEAALERGVLLDVLAVLVERGRADRAQLAAGEHRLEQVRGVDRALGRAGADDRVQLVHEQDDGAAGLLDLVEDRLEAL